MCITRSQSNTSTDENNRKKILADVNRNNNSELSTPVKRLDQLADSQNNSKKAFIENIENHNRYNIRMQKLDLSLSSETSKYFEKQEPSNPKEPEPSLAAMKDSKRISNAKRKLVLDLSIINGDTDRIKQANNDDFLDRFNLSACESIENEPKKSKWEPPNWREVFDLIRQMRGDQTAPVDTMGCDALSRLPPNLSPQTQRFQVLVSLMLSAQTKDEVTAGATNRLQELPLDVDTIINTNEETISKLIYPVSFYKRKAQYIKRTAAILKDEYESDIPDNVKELCKLPGVGPKMAYIAMSVAWNKCAGIGVDTHVHRISNRLGWTKKQTKQPEQTRKELEDWLPESYWNEVNHLLVGFGQQTCRPVGPKCDTCLAKDLCPTGRVHVKPKKQTSKSKLNPQNE